MTKIQWTDATWNPIRGCSIVSPGCSNCYAMKQAHRFSGKGGAYEGLTKLTNGGPVWAGKVRPVPELLDQPLRWRKPRRIFVNSMSDLFHEDVPDTFIRSVFAAMAVAQQHTFQVLTKRPERMCRWMRAAGREGWVRAAQPDRWARRETWPGWPLPNVWLGVSAEDQARADERIPMLLSTPAAVRFVSAEPLLGPIDLRWIAQPDDDRDGVIDSLTGKDWIDEPCPSIPKVRMDRFGGTSVHRKDVADCARVDWVIVGGESGHRARPCELTWIRGVLDQCRSENVRVFVKQLGGRPQEVAHPSDVTPDEARRWWRDGWTRITDSSGTHWRRYMELKDRKGGDPSEWPEDLRVREFPSAGHEVNRCR